MLMLSDWGRMRGSQQRRVGALVLDPSTSNMTVRLEEKLMTTTRMLCLHGYHGSAAILYRQIAPLAAALPAHVELVFVDAPSLSSGDLGWWHEGFRGWERTRDWAIGLLNLQQFDGIFGFSQGAAAAGSRRRTNKKAGISAWLSRRAAAAPSGSGSETSWSGSRAKRS